RHATRRHPVRERTPHQQSPTFASRRLIGRPLGPVALPCPARMDEGDPNLLPADMRRAMDVQDEVRATDNGVLNPPADSRPVRLALVFTIIALALLMMSIDATIVATALHALQRELQTTIDWAGWTITSYSLGFVVT